MEANGASQVNKATKIYIQFSETMDNTSITAITSGSSCSGTIQLSLDSFSNCIPMTSSPPFNNNKIFIFDPSINLGDTPTYRIKVTTGVKDGSGISMEDDNITSSGFTVSKFN